jgi:hypothetical protein
VCNKLKQAILYIERNPETVKSITSFPYIARQQGSQPTRATSTPVNQSRDPKTIHSDLRSRATEGQTVSQAIAATSGFVNVQWWCKNL